MTPPALTREQCRKIDRRAIEEYGFSGLVLMENAGRGQRPDDRAGEFGNWLPIVNDTPPLAVAPDISDQDKLR